MVCRSCQTVIADKAIVCYRCGTPTAMPEPARKAPAPAAGGLWTIVAAGILMALASWFLMPVRFGLVVRWAALAVVAVVVLMTIRIRRGRA